MLSCSPIGPAAGLPSCPEDTAVVLPPFSSTPRGGSWAQRLRLTKKVLRHKQIFPRGIFSPSPAKEASMSQDESSSMSHDLFFQRFLGMRNSFKSLKLSSPAAGVIKEPPQHLESCSSKDSGLGEEGVSSNRILSHRSPSENGGGVKKHVMIREPSLSTLPSSQRRARNSCCVVKTRVYSGPSHLLDSGALSVKTVERQWEELYSKAYEELLAVRPDLDPHPLKIIFRRDPKSSSALDVEDIAAVLRSIYSILFHNWTGRKSPFGFLSFTLHCIHLFLVSAIRNLDLQAEPELREKACKRFENLQRNCEIIGYHRVDICLSLSRSNFLDFWVSLLDLPLYKDSLSAS